MQLVSGAGELVRFISGGIEEMAPKAIQALDTLGRVLGLPPLALPRAHERSAQDKHSGSHGRPWPAGDSRGPCRRGADVPGRLRCRIAEGPTGVASLTSAVTCAASCRRPPLST